MWRGRSGNWEQRCENNGTKSLCRKLSGLWQGLTLGTCGCSQGPILGHVTVARGLAGSVLWGHVAPLAPQPCAGDAGLWICIGSHFLWHQQRHSPALWHLCPVQMMLGCASARVLYEFPIDTTAKTLQPKCSALIDSFSLQP